jgi:hypothetical protein
VASSKSLQEAINPKEKQNRWPLESTLLAIGATMTMKRVLMRKRRRRSGNLRSRRKIKKEPVFV